ncbi:MAG: hypothetical protein D6687_01205 [Acidobacteria bacterium]|jgi:tetratricopeptide (TPR) repeat protein|nr:MAG: hypothetical protein D6687_01205 [Acidobacteriota bacterium]GIU82013.1 MAG: hypothetical protein KatS3mg006_1077 [Pyrinomonadaceae bacterium]
MSNFRKGIILLVLSVFLFEFATAQKSRPTPKPSEKEELQKAFEVENPTERISALKAFLEKFPNSKNKNAVLEALVVAYISLAETKLKSGAVEESIRHFREAVSNLPEVITDDFFTKNLLKIPNLLFLSGQQTASVEIARLIEEKISSNAKQLIALATFYLNIEDGESAERLAEKALQVDEKLLSAYQTLGLANRLNFDLEASAKAYEKALEIEPNSIFVKQNLADTKRALGKFEEALEIYQEILQAEPNSIPAKTGLVLSLLELGKLDEAESELEKAKEEKNFILLAGAAYWYARESFKVKEYSDKAVSMAQQAIEIQPRYVWSYIALARGFLAQNKPNDAERVLLTARQYGNFPTLDYELAAARFASGFYGEAVETLEKSFSVSDDGTVETRLGNRIARRSEDFSELLSLELRAGIFQQKRADNKEESQKLKTLLLLHRKLKEKEVSEADVVRLAEEFVRDDDKTKAYRLIFTAERLMERKIALPKALDFLKEVASRIEQALEVPSASSFVLSDQLYESRKLAMSKGQLIVIPQIPRQTLSSILRGKIEEVTGWTLYQQNKISEAIVHLKRAVSILPENSAWWRSSWWRLGACYEANGELQKALDAYIRSYRSGEPDSLRLTVIENLYKKIHGNLDGLENLLQARNQTRSDFLMKQPEEVRNLAERSEVAQNEEAKVTEEAQMSVETKLVEESDGLKAGVLLDKPEDQNQSNQEQRSLNSEQTELGPDMPKNQLKEEANQAKAEDARIEKEIENQEIKSQEIENPKVEDLESRQNETPNARSDSMKDSSEIEQSTDEDVKSQDAIAEVSNANELKTSNIDNKQINEIKSSEPESISKPVSSEEAKLVFSEESKTENSQFRSEEGKANLDKVERKPSRRVEVVIEDYLAQKNDVKKEEEKKDLQNELLKAGQIRPRVVRIELLQQRQDCSLVVNQEEISILRSGGRLGILVGYSGADEDLSKILAVSESPADIEVEYEPEVAKTSKQLFLVIKSVSERSGLFKVLLKSPCGSREIRVRVK